MKPIIGIVGRCQNNDGYSLIGVVDQLRNAVIKCAGIPILILPTQLIEYDNIKEDTPNKLTEEEKEDLIRQIKLCDGIIIPGGTKIFEYDKFICKYTIKNDINTLGICLGMQIAVIEYARNVAGITDAHSGEFDELCRHKVIDFMPGQSEDIDKGGTLRLGAYPCVIKSGTTMARCYGTDRISERHRHRYEFNNDYREKLMESGLTLSGLSPDGRIVEMLEIPEHPWFVATQAHPEFKSRPNHPHPLFKGFVGASIKRAL